MAKHFGKCALCGCECDLSFEHIPPRAAFNSTPARPVSGSEILTDKNINDPDRMPWDVSGLKYENQQQGMGRYSLCESCNNNTGSWYGAEYIKFIHTIHMAIQKRAENPGNVLEVQDIYPLRIIKQILSMFCSTNNPDNPLFHTIRQFVLNREATGLDKAKFKVCMYFTDTTLIKYTGFNVVLHLGESGPSSMALSELTAYPLGFILYFDPTEEWDYQGFDITAFADWPYDKTATVQMPWKIQAMNDMFPEMYRSRDEIRKFVEEHRKRDDRHES